MSCKTNHHDCNLLANRPLAKTDVIGARTWIGIGGIISNNISLCGDVVIGAGAVVVRNIDKAGTYVGVPARKISNP